MYCIVTGCPSTDHTHPDKRFFSVPNIPKHRKSWLLACRGNTNFSNNSHCVVCEDHFKFPDDLKNPFQVQLTGARPRLRVDVVPHIFEDKKQVVPKPRVLSEARKRKKMVEELLAESAELPPTSSKSIQDISNDEELTEIIQLEKSILICGGRNPPVISKKKPLHHAKPKQHKPGYNFSCYMCDKKFSCKMNLNSHSFCHIGTEPYVCKNPNCYVKFSTMKRLMYHVKQEHEISLLKQVLSEELVQDLMSQHVIIPQAIIPVEICEFCVKGFTSKTKLFNHKCNVLDKNKKQKLESQSSPPADVASQKRQQVMQNATSDQNCMDIMKVKPCCVMLDQREVSRYLAAHGKNEEIKANTIRCVQLQDLICPSPAVPVAAKRKKCELQQNSTNNAKKLCTESTNDLSSQLERYKNVDLVNVSDFSEIDESVSKNSCLTLEEIPLIPKIPDLESTSLNPLSLVVTETNIPNQVMINKTEDNEIKIKLENQCNDCDFKSTCDITFNSHLLEHNLEQTSDNVRLSLNLTQSLSSKNRCMKKKCPRSFESEDSLYEHFMANDHTRMKTQYKYLKCKFCQYVSISKRLEDHLEAEHWQDVLQLAGYHQRIVA